MRAILIETLVKHCRFYTWRE